MYKIINIEHLMPRLTKNGQSAVGINYLSEQEYLIFHNDGVIMGDNSDPIQRAIADATYYVNVPGRWWAYSSPYHFMIGRREDNEIYQALPLEEVTYHCSNEFYNMRSLALTFQGNYNEQTLTPTQIKKAEWLIGELKKKLPNLKGINYHRKVGLMTGSATSCPGKNAIPQVESFMTNFNNINNKKKMERPEAKRLVYIFYRLILGREPENDVEVENHATTILESGIEELLRIFTVTPEYRGYKESLLKTPDNTIREEDFDFYFNQFPNGVVRSVPEILSDKGFFN